jgi:hypothetical protein
MRILVLAFVPILLIFACAMVILWVPLPAPAPAPLSKARNLAAAITVGVVGMAYMIGLTVYLIAAFVDAGKALDPALTPLGLTPERYMLAGRRYRGTIEGRHVEVRYTPAQNINLAVLEMYVSADTGMRLALGRQRPLLDCQDCPRVEVAGAGLAGIQVFCQEEARARSLLADPATRAAVARLLPGQQALYVQPDQVWFRAHSRHMQADVVHEWLDDLLLVADHIAHLRNRVAE